MAAYARIYGFWLRTYNQICENEDDYTCIGSNSYLTNSEYEMLQEILEKEF